MRSPWPSRGWGEQWRRPRIHLPQATAVVIDVSHDDRGGDALDWAAAEAAARHIPLRILHAVSVPWLVDAWGTVDLPAPSGAALDSAGLVLDGASRRATSVAPELVVTTHLHLGTTAAALRGAESGALLVLGSGEDTSVRTGLRRTSAARFATQTHMPMVFVSLTDPRSVGPSRGRVVVGLDDAAAFGEALSFAFDAARRRRVGITVVRPWSRPATGSQPSERPSFVPSSTAFEDAFPDIDVRNRMLAEPTSDAWLDESDGAALVVLRAARHRGLSLMNAGGMHSTVGRIRAPVVLVPQASRSGRSATPWSPWATGPRA